MYCTAAKAGQGLTSSIKNLIVDTWPQGDGVTERRKFYRVEDILPILLTKIDNKTKDIRSRIMSGSALACPLYREEEKAESDVTLPPKLWRVLGDIDFKLNMLLDRFTIESEGLNKACNRRVSISPHGLNLTAAEKFEVNDLLEMKILLASYPATAVMLYGVVTRVQQLETGEYDTGIIFKELESDVQNVLAQYMFNRQREIIRRQIQD